MQDRYSDIVSRIAASITDLAPQLQTAAQYLLEHPEDVGLNSMRAVAREAGVTPATISRLSKALGFSSYQQLREPFKEQLRRRAPEYASRLRDVQQRGTDDVRALFEDVRAQDVENIQRTLADDNYPIFLAAVETLRSSRRVYVLGLRGAFSAAFLFHYTYQLFRDNSLLVDAGAGIFADQLRSISADDSMLAISFPPYTQLTIDAIGHAAEAGTKIVAITDSNVSPAARAATHTIITHDRSPSFYQSFNGALTVSQMLIALLVAKSGGNARKIVDDVEKQLSRISAYW